MSSISALINFFHSFHVICGFEGWINRIHAMFQIHPNSLRYHCDDCKRTPNFGIERKTFC